MLKIDDKHYHALAATTHYSQLIPFLQQAILTEHIVMVAYLSAIFSIKPNTMPYAYNTYKTISLQEMLHMTIVANIVSALGGTPQINANPEQWQFPTKLPLGLDADMQIGLEKYTLDTTRNIFMRIEMPVHAINADEQKVMDLPQGFVQSEFYDLLKQKLQELAPDSMPGDPTLQVVENSKLPDSQLFAIKTKDDAIKAITIVNEQGEGSHLSPVDSTHELSHFYRFAELYHQQAIVKNPNLPLGFDYTGDDYPYELNSVYNTYPNTKASMLPANIAERKLLDAFNTCYTTLMDQLQKTFTGHANFMGHSGYLLMYELRTLGEQIAATPFPNKQGYNLGMPFEYTTPIADADLPAHLDKIAAQKQAAKAAKLAHSQNITTH